MQVPALGNGHDVEEVESFIAAGKPTRLNFSNQPVLPDSVDPVEYRRFRKVQERAE